MGYKKSFIKGVSWSSSFRIITRSFSFFKVIFLARILSPSQFGIFGIAVLILELLELLTETGINVFLVQSKKDVSEYINSAWVISICRGFLIALVMILLANPIASFFNTPEVRQLVLVMSIIPLIRGVINPAIVSFQKELKFGSEFWFRSSIFLIDFLVSITIAFITRSVYSLVAGVLAGAIFEVVLSFIILNLRPRFLLRRAHVNEIITRGKWVTAYGVLNYISQRGDNIVVGKMFGSTSLGIYQMAYNIAILPISEISDVINKVAFPVFVKIRNEKKRLFNAFFITSLIVSILSFCLASLLFLFSEDIVLLALGEKWASVIPILKLLSVYGFIRAVYGTSAALFLAIEKQKYVTVMNLAKVLVMAILILPLGVNFGITGVVIAVIFSAVVEIPIVIYFLIKTIRSYRK